MNEIILILTILHNCKYNTNDEYNAFKNKFVDIPHAVISIFIYIRKKAIFFF